MAGSPKLKRLFDVAFSMLLLIVASPLMVVCAALIWFEDGLPLLFRQSRVGLNGKAFTILKFRSMRQAAGSLVTTRGDTRITRVGRYLRNLKLDELPQLFNVLRGDMSLVGPRPEVAEFLNSVDPEKVAQRHSVRPGITGPTALEFADEERLLQGYADPIKAYREVVFPRKLELDLKYVEQQSLLSDFTIVFKTAFAVAQKVFRRS